MYKPGDLIVYGATGVCRVVEVAVPPGEAEGRFFYTLEPLYESCTIRTPADNTKVFMRPIISAQEADRLIEAIPTLSGEAYHNKVMRELVEHYEASMKSHSCQDLIELTMSIYAKKQGAAESKRKFGAIDERFMKRAEELLFGELAAALGIERDAVPGYIAGQVAALEA